MTTTFDDALALTLKFEGGYVNDPADKGGATNFGITQKVYDHYLNGLGDPLNDVADISSAEVAAIYRMWYWNPAHADALVSRLAKVHFDSAVNHGVGRAVKFLQQLVGVTTDGMWGPATFAAVASADQDALVTPYLALRRAFYGKIVAADATQAKFLPQWLKRLEELQAAVA